MFHVVIPTATAVTTLTGLQYVGLLVAVGALIFTAAVHPAQDASTIAHRPFMLITVTCSMLAVIATIRVTGLDQALSLALSPWRKPFAVHDPGKIILDLALILALGGDTLSDLATLRAEPGIYGLVASDPQYRG